MDYNVEKLERYSEVSFEHIEVELI